MPGIDRRKLREIFTDLVQGLQRPQTLPGPTPTQLQEFLLSHPVVLYCGKAQQPLHLTFLSENVVSLSGYPAAAFLADPHFWLNRVHPEDRPRILREFAQLSATRPITTEYRFCRQDGSYCWLQDQRRLVQAEGTVNSTQAPEIAGCWQDITERKLAQLELQKRDRLLQGVVEVMKDLLSYTDYRTAIARALKTLGTAAGVDRVYIYQNHPHPQTGEAAMSIRFEWTSQSLQATLNPPQWHNLTYSHCGLDRWHRVLSQGQVLMGLTRDFPSREQALLQRDGIASVLLVPILLEQKFWGFIGFDDFQRDRQWHPSEVSLLQAIALNISSVLKRYQTETQLRYFALRDPLTGLANRTLFMKRLQQALRLSKRCRNYQFAVLYLDLDRFKAINDSLGHRVGDQLLVAIARRLEACLRPLDSLARLGGDEFTILLHNLQTPQDATRVVERLQRELAAPFYLNGQEIFTSASIGIAVSGSEDDCPENLLRDADMATYRAKQQGRDRHAIFDATMRTHAISRLQLETDLRGAIAREELVVYYQPILCLATGKITGFEALIRWQHPERGLLLPQEFIGIAEETGLILPIGQFVLQQACKQLRDWQRQFPQHPVLSVNVNLSGKQLAEPNLVQQIQQILAETGLEGNCLKLEITESVLLENDATTLNLLSQLRDLNLQLYIDDFGAGYSSLSYLHCFPINALKIDRSFISGIGVRGEAVEIVRTIIILAYNLGLQVVAEGIETPSQRDQLRTLQCEYGQGYLFSRPVCCRRATALIAQQF